jgi:hypothetical protein
VAKYKILESRIQLRDARSWTWLLCSSVDQFHKVMMEMLCPSDREWQFPLQIGAKAPISAVAGHQSYPRASRSGFFWRIAMAKIPQ